VDGLFRGKAGIVTECAQGDSDTVRPHFGIPEDRAAAGGAEVEDDLLAAFADPLEGLRRAGDFRSAAIEENRHAEGGARAPLARFAMAERYPQGRGFEADAEGAAGAGSRVLRHRSSLLSVILLEPHADGEACVGDAVVGAVAEVGVGGVVDRRHDVHRFRDAHAERGVLAEEEAAAEERAGAAVEVAVVHRAAGADLGEEGLGDRHMPVEAEIGLVRRVRAAGHAYLDARLEKRLGKAGLRGMEGRQIDLGGADEALVMGRIAIEAAANAHADLIDKIAGQRARNRKAGKNRRQRDRKT